MEKAGRVDVLISAMPNFTTIAKGPFDMTATAQGERVLKVNVTGTCLCVRAVADHMLTPGFGRIIDEAPPRHKWPRSPDCLDRGYFVVPRYS